MKRVYLRCMALMAGMMSVFLSGCITGTNTFSNTAIPATRYCGIDDSLAPVFDVHLSAKDSSYLNDDGTFQADGKSISLLPE